MKKLLSLILLAATLVCGLALTACGETVTPKVVDIKLTSEEYAFCVNKADTELLAAANSFLAEIKSNGTFDAICNNYFGDGTPLKFESKALDPTKDQLIVATSTGFEPFEMEEGGKFYGIDMEIAYYLAQKLGKELVIQDMQFEAVVASVNGATYEEDSDNAGQAYTGQKCHIGMAGLTVKPSREKVVTFTDSYYNASQVVITKSDDTAFANCTTKEDVFNVLASLGADKKIGCQKGTTGEKFSKNAGDDGFKATTGLDLNAESKSFDYAGLAITAMINGQVDYVVLDNAPANAITAKMNKTK